MSDSSDDMEYACGILVCAHCKEHFTECTCEDDEGFN